MTETKGVFQDVDQSGVASELMAYLDRVAARPEMRRAREKSYELLELAPGQAVLEVGCGPGHALGEMAKIVGPTGRAIGIELSAAMAAEAARRVPLPQVDVRVGDLLALDIADASVDAARAERVFQHVTETAQGCDELARVVRPGGRVAILDPDWSTLRVIGPDQDLVAEVRDAWHAKNPNPDGVLDLPGALLDAGFTEVQMVPAVLRHHDLAVAAQILVMLDSDLPAVHWPISAEVGARWFAALDAADRAGRFWCSLVTWTVVARRG